MAGPPQEDGLADGGMHLLRFQDQPAAVHPEGEMMQVEIHSWMLEPPWGSLWLRGDYELEDD